jgi:hypothetical protein
VDKENARHAMVAFLDQFIERGAEPDVIALRDWLRDSPASTALSGRPLSAEATPGEVYEAMRELFVLFSKPSPHACPHPDLEELHRWTRVEADGSTSDPAQLEDWSEVVRRLLST